MNVVFLTEGGKDVGLGHITRCISLYQAFEERGVASILIVNGDRAAEGVLSGKKYKIIDWLENHDEMISMVGGADVAVVDSYLAPYEFYEALSHIVRLPVYFDDDRRLDYPEGIIVNGAINAEQISYPRRERLIYLLGTGYTLLRKAFWRVPDREIRDNLETIMITFGGNDTRNMTPKVLKLLTGRHQFLRKKVVIGEGFTHTDEIKQVIDDKTELIYGPNDETIISIMLESDIALSAAGQTLYELARTGTPTIAIGVADNQSHNISGWLKEGFINFAGWWDDAKVMSNIETEIEMLEGAEVRHRKSETGRASMSGGGSKRLAEAIFKLI